jgi:uncharacterized protein
LRAIRSTGEPLPWHEGAVKTRAITIPGAGPGEGAVSGVLHGPEKGAAVALALGHGAGSDMNTPAMIALAEALAERGRTVLRFNFPYKERGGKAPDPAPTLERTWRAAIEALRATAPEKLFIGGKSMGGRYASIVASKGAACDGLVFLGYPLHPPGKPEQLRDKHLAKVAAPMLFVSGTRDPLCDLALLRPVLARIGDRATLHVIEGGDHSFDVLKSSGRSKESVAAEVLDTVEGWLTATSAKG